MIKRLILAAVTCTAIAGAAIAQDKPAAPDKPAAAQAAPAEGQAADPAVDACLQKAFDLAQSAEQKKLTEQDLDQLEKLLGTMEAHCDAKESAAADKVAGEIKSMIDSKQ